MNEVRPLDVQSPSNAYDTARDRYNNPMKLSPPLKGTPSSSNTSHYLRGFEDEMEATHSRNIENNKSSLQLSPIVCADVNAPYSIHLTHSETQNTRISASLLGEDNTRNDSTEIDTSFPDNREDTVDLFHSPGITSGDERGVKRDESDEERMQREIEESEALARQLMAEEAMASYAMSTEYLRENADQFSSEDFAALQAAIAEEDPENNLEEGYDDDDDDDSESRELSYDALLRLGERIGDVKEERWALVAREKINQLTTLVWTSSMAEGKEENHTAVKCQVCQFPYEESDELRELPCEHYFHKDCIDSWLETKDTCALCRKSIVADN